MTFPSTEAEPLSSLLPTLLAPRRLDRGSSITSASPSSRAAGGGHTRSCSTRGCPEEGKNRTGARGALRRVSQPPAVGFASSWYPFPPLHLASCPWPAHPAWPVARCSAARLSVVCSAPLSGPRLPAAAVRGCPPALVPVNSCPLRHHPHALGGYPRAQQSGTSAVPLPSRGAWEVPRLKSRTRGLLLLSFRAGERGKGGWLRQPHHAQGVTCSSWRGAALSAAPVHLLSVHPAEPAPAWSSAAASSDRAAACRGFLRGGVQPWKLHQHFCQAVAARSNSPDDATVNLERLSWHVYPPALPLLLQKWGEKVQPNRFPVSFTPACSGGVVFSGAGQAEVKQQRSRLRGRAPGEHPEAPACGCLEVRDSFSCQPEGLDSPLLRI